MHFFSFTIFMRNQRFKKILKSYRLLPAFVLLLCLGEGETLNDMEATYFLKSKANLNVRFVGAKPYSSIIVMHHRKYHHCKNLEWVNPFTLRPFIFVLRFLWTAYHNHTLADTPLTSSNNSQQENFHSLFGSL